MGRIPATVERRRGNKATDRLRSDRRSAAQSTMREVTGAANRGIPAGFLVVAAQRDDPLVVSFHGHVTLLGRLLSSVDEDVIPGAPGPGDLTRHVSGPTALGQSKHLARRDVLSGACFR